MKLFYKKLRIAATVAGVLFSLQSYALTIGSNYFTFKQSHVVFKANGHNNNVSNFSWLADGFTLEDATTTCTFNSIYQVSGLLDFNGGTLVLEQDLLLRETITFQSFGTIKGQGHVFDFTQVTFAPVAPTGNLIIEDLQVYSNSNFILTTPFITKGSCSLNGGGGTFTLFDGLGSIVVDSNSTLTLSNVIIDGVSANNIQCVDDTAQIVFDNVTILQTGDYTFSTGSMSIVNNIDWKGSFTFLYDSAQPITIQSQSTLHFFEGLTFATGRLADNAPESLLFVDQTSILSLEDATLSINSHGAQFINGTLETTGIVIIEVNSTSTATALEFGDNNAAHDVAFHFNGGSITNFNNGLAIFNVTTFAIPQPSGGSITIEQGPASILLFEQNYNLNNITLNLSPLSEIQIAPGKQLLLTNVIALTATGGSYVVTGFFEVGIGFLLNGNQNLNLVSGTAGFAILVNGAGNRLSGAGSITFPVVLLGGGAELTWALTGQLATNLVLNGGELSLASNLNLGNSIVLAGSGTVNLNNQALITSYVDYDAGSFVDPILWQGSTGVVALQTNVVLDAAWTFSGNCFIVGNGNNLDITHGEIIVAPGSNLEFHNISINGLTGNNIRCLDDSASIVFDDVSIRLSDIYTFTIGSITFEGAVAINSGGEFNDHFVYQSDKPLLVNAFASLLFDVGVTFSYDASSPDLLQFVDQTSVLALTDATLVAAQQGLNLTRGSLLITGNSLLFTDSAITLGDCFTGTNDFNVAIASNSQLEIASGFFNYKNVNAASWHMQSTSVLRTDGGAQLNLYQILNLGTGSAVFGNNATIGNQANLIGSSSQEGILNTVTLPPC